MCSGLEKEKKEAKHSCLSESEGPTAKCISIVT